MPQQLYVLSLDIGANSVGWAALACDEQGEATGFLEGQSLGAHVFDAGVENFFGSGQGKEESRGAVRRAARIMRRQLQRRARRQGKTYNILAEAGLLPQLKVEASTPVTAEARREYDAALAHARDLALKALDLQLAAKLDTKEAREHLPYVLRARALDDKLGLFELGRALYHIAQRRGFKSARKGGSGSPDEDTGAIKAAIKATKEQVDPSGTNGKARTLGELLARRATAGMRLRPHLKDVPRGDRKLYQQEFAAIWNAQAKHHPQVLTEALREKLAGKKGDGGAIFHQRPLKLQDDLIGVCDIYDGVKRKPSEKRAPWASMEAQRFRLLQRVNDLRIVENEISRALNAEERKKLIEVLEVSRKLTLKRAKDGLSVPGVLNLGKKAKLNFGRDDEDEATDFLPGNRTAADLCGIFGEAVWRALPAERQREIADACWKIDDAETLANLAVEQWGLSPEQAMRLDEDVSLEDDYCGLSRKALLALLPRMEQAEPYTTAKIAVFGEDPAPPIRDLLPPVKEHLPTLRNPVVSRALTELRRVVNAVIKRHGKPFMVRIELAREMKKSKKQREEILIENKKREKRRRAAAAEIVAKAGDILGVRNPDDVKPLDIERKMLLEECNCICPYTGQNISMQQLFNGEVDVEHIIPYSRSLDNSFQNKTLCFHSENLNKARRTPFEAYGHTDKWGEIVGRIERFKNPDKLRRFELHGTDLEKFLNEFTNAQLVNTAYAAKLALDYLGTLYGLPPGKSHTADASGRQKIQVCNGRLTSLFRAAWRLNDILGEDGKKKRTDHRHHAVDAVCIGVTTVKSRQKLERQVAEFERKRPVGSNKQFSLKHGDVPPPWGDLQTFMGEVSGRIASCNVSHRVDKKVSGALHDESLYSPRYDAKGRPDPSGEYSHIRKPVHLLSADAINSEDELDKKGALKNAATIVDAEIRRCVQQKLKELGDPKKLEQDPPKMKSGMPIRRVRIRKKNKTLSVGHGIRRRQVESGSNHHVEIVQVIDKKGNPKWEMRFVTMLEAHRRQKQKQPVVNRTAGPDEEFVCSLVSGDAFLWEAEEATPEVFRVRTLDGTGKIWFVRNPEARKKADFLDEDKQSMKLAKASGKQRAAAQQNWFQASGNVLREGKFQKVTITPLGEVRPVND
ncbi:MAG: hypothetical protein BroJett014_20590 [Planctomycetota bacterium]|nr:MAG: hypothetical protein BroJett014_20590 [Planctomycetota bacterium]